MIIPTRKLLTSLFSKFQLLESAGLAYTSHVFAMLSFIMGRKASTWGWCTIKQQGKRRGESPSWL